jgi:deazaflavin-dependent oxidoreductase (nitroreductase family)
VSEALGATGVFGDFMVRLETTGRKSGKSYSLPVVIAVVDGERYLVSMLGENVNWVRNVRVADGRATLQWGRREEVRLVEVPVAERAPVIRAYVKRAPGGRPHIPVHTDAPLAEFEAIAADFPVFRITPADAAAAS